MRRIDGGKERVLTRGGLMNVESMRQLHEGKERVSYPRRSHERRVNRRYGVKLVMRSQQKA